jgi:tripartite-type tricarboxylate transporter receptor subunit TctC
MKNMFFLLAISCLLLGCNTKKTEEFPNRPINLYVGFQPGGGTDMAARALASLATEYLGKPIIVVNMPGASGALAANKVAASKPDGYTLLVAGGSETVSVGHFKKLPYHPLNSFSPIIRITVEKIVLSVNKDAPFKTLDEFISEAKKHPGKFTYSSSGHFGIFHSTALAFCREAGIVMKHVPYNGDASIVAALIGNHIDLAINSQVAVIPLLESNQINSLAQSSMDKRSPLLPDTPTLKELGFNISIENQKGIVAPANTPRDRIMLLHDCFKKIIENPEFIGRAKKLQLEVAYLNPQDFQSSLQSIYDQIGIMLK